MDNEADSKFPEGFLFGVSTSAYQVEGAWSKNDGKGENIWDNLTHTNPDAIVDGSNGDIACNAYHTYKEDVKLMKEIGFQMYRFSISWSRILPNGDTSEINEKGVWYYRSLIKELLDNGIEPIVTLYHWDLPQTLQQFGGWLNPVIIDYFVDYARLVFKLYGDKVKWWCTFNEPKEIVRGYGTKHYAPYLKLESFGGDYLVAHNLLKAHAKAYHVYDKEFRPEQKGKVFIILNGHFRLPKNEDNDDDKKAAERANQFEYGWFAHPIFSEEGDYPPIMRELVDKRSEGRPRSRLPSFTPEEIKEIQGTSDFLGMNYYSSMLTTNGRNPHSSIPIQDANYTEEQDLAAPRSPNVRWLRVTPWAFRKMFSWMKKEYNNPTIFVTENGYGDTGVLDDIDRIKYFHGHLEAMLKAIHIDHCNVIGYMPWTLLDDFEWLNGYTYKFGIVHVDFNDPERKRTSKKSVNFIRETLATRTLPQIDGYVDNANASNTIPE